MADPKPQMPSQEEGREKIINSAIQHLVHNPSSEGQEQVRQQYELSEEELKHVAVEALQQVLQQKEGAVSAAGFLRSGFRLTSEDLAIKNIPELFQEAIIREWRKRDYSHDQSIFANFPFFEDKFLKSPEVQELVKKLVTRYLEIGSIDEASKNIAFFDLPEDFMETENVKVSLSAGLREKVRKYKVYPGHVIPRRHPST